MPGGDGTGPFGTLRNCMPVNTNGNQATAAQAPFYGRGFYGRAAGRGRGMGRGFRWRYLATGVPGWAAQLVQQPAQAQGKPVQGDSREMQEKGKTEEKLSQLEKELEKIKQKIKELKGD